MSDRDVAEQKVRAEIEWMERTFREGVGGEPHGSEPLKITLALDEARALLSPVQRCTSEVAERVGEAQKALHMERSGNTLDVRISTQTIRHWERKLAEAARLLRTAPSEGREPDALRNCLLLATRMRRKGDPEPWDHIIRFCKEGGVEPQILRGTPSDSPVMGELSADEIVSAVADHTVSGNVEDYDAAVEAVERLLRGRRASDSPPSEGGASSAEEDLVQRLRRLATTKRISEQTRHDVVLDPQEFADLMLQRKEAAKVIARLAKGERAAFMAGVRWRECRTTTGRAPEPAISADSITEAFDRWLANRTAETGEADHG